MKDRRRILHHRSLSASCVASLYGFFPLGYVVGASHRVHEQGAKFLACAGITAVLGLIICIGTPVLLLKDSRTGYPALRCSVATLLWSFACVPVLFLTAGIVRGLMR